MISLQVAANIKMVVAAQCVVDLCDVGVQLDGVRCGPGERRSIQTIPFSRTVRLRIFVELGENVWINSTTPWTCTRAGAIRIHFGQLGFSKANDAFASGNIFHYSLPERIRWPLQRFLDVFGSFLCFVVQEKKDLVTLY